MHFLPRRIRFPGPIADGLAQHFWRGQNPSPNELAKTGRALAILWPLLAKDRGQAETQHYSFSPDQANAYASYYLPANLLKVTAVLAEAESLGLDLFSEKNGKSNWVDVGSGPGTAAGGLAWWSQFRKGPARVTNIDQSPVFLRTGKEIVSTLRTRFTQAIPEMFWKKSGKKLLDDILEEKPQVVSFVNSIGEIFSNVDLRAKFIETLIENLFRESKIANAPRWLCIIEPGSRDSSRELLALRDRIRNIPAAKILLPCLDARPCGAFAVEKDWCHEEIGCDFPDWLNTLGASAGMRKESMLFSYLLIAVGAPPELPSWPENGLRMVSQRLEHKGLTECWFCTKDAKRRLRFTTSIQKKRDVPLEIPSRGAIFSSIDASEKGEVNALRNTPIYMKNIVDIFPEA